MSSTRKIQIGNYVVTKPCFKNSECNFGQPVIKVKNLVKVVYAYADNIQCSNDWIYLEEDLEKIPNQRLKKARYRVMQKYSMDFNVLRRYHDEINKLHNPGLN